MLHLTPEQLAVASPEERQMYHQALQLHLAKATPLDYASYVSKGVQRYRHTVLLSDRIARLVRGKLLHPTTGQPVRKLAVSMPPRFGKSFIISDHTPAWAVTAWAPYGFRVGLGTYEADFGKTWGRKARTHLQDHPEFGVRIDNTSHAADAWDLLPAGPGAPVAGMNTAGVGGPFTGRGFHLLLIDDPIKNNEWAMSSTIREKQWDWFGSTALTRLEPTITVEEDGEQLEIGHAVILVNTRWHEDDLMGRVLKEEPDEWYHLNLKAIADERAPVDDALGRQPGEPLCPERFPLEELEKIRDNPTTGGYWWAAMYQGEPSIEGGGIFKRANFRYHRPGPGDTAVTHIALKDPTGAETYVPRVDLNRFSTLDTAATVKTYSDWSVLLTFDVTADRKLLLVDRVRQRLESADLEEWVYSHFLRLTPGYIGVGATTYGLTVITQLQRRGVPVRPLSEQKDDKISRAITAGSLIDAGRVFFPEGAPWLPDFEHELLQFPKGAHDDQVDALAHGAREVAIGPWSTAARHVEPDDQSLEGRLHRFTEKRIRKIRTRRHPDLGRL